MSDKLGRIRQGSALLNLAVPTFAFTVKTG
jgi:hypothetical protein